MKALEWILAAFVAAGLLLLAVIVGGCSGVPPARTVQALECRVALLEPYLGPLTEEIVSEGIRNPGAIVDALMSLGLTPPEVMRLGDSWRACAGSPPPPSLPAQVAPTSGGPNG